MITESSILKALGRVEEPDLQKDLVSLGMIENIEIHDNRISFDVVLTTPACPLKELIENRCRAELKAELGEDIQVKIRMTSRVSTARNHDLNVLPNVKNIICVASGKGGVGKSTVSVQLALALARQGAKVGLMDTDIHGPSVPMMLGMRNQKPSIREIKGKTYILPIEYNEHLKVLSIGFLVDERQAIVWRGPMVTSALKQFVGDVLWGELDYLILDMPPGTGDVQLTIAQLLKITCAVVVSTPQQVAVADARKAISMFRVQGLQIPIAGIVENMAYFTPPDLENMPEKKYYIFGQGGAKQLAEEYDVPFLGEIPLIQKVRENADSGEQENMDQNIVETFDTLAQNVARSISILNVQQALPDLSS